MNTKLYNYSAIVFILLVNLMITSSGFGQVYEKMSYQAVIRDASNNLVVNQTVGMQVSIMVGVGTAYIETHTPTANANGLVSIEVGGGTLVAGSWSSIYWAYEECFIKTDVDPTGGTNYTITVISQLLSVPYAINAERAEIADTANVALVAENVIVSSAGNGIDILNGVISNTAISTTYEVGDYAQGGVVFWVDETGEHGLVCDTHDEGYWYWSPDVTGEVVAYGNGPYSGEMNTTLIIAKYGLPLNFFYHAYICANRTSGGYGDWYLPSSLELYEMYLNKDEINATLSANGGELLENINYWSSTEHTSSHAHTRNLGTGEEGNTHKKTNVTGRAIRGF